MANNKRQTATIKQQAADISKPHSVRLLNIQQHSNVAKTAKRQQQSNSHNN
jgi:hypothetical protein